MEAKPTTVPVADPPMTRRVLTLAERESLKDQIAFLGYGQDAGEGYVPGSQGFGLVAPPGFRVNRPRLNEQQKRCREVLAAGTPEPVAAKDRDALKKRCDELLNQFEPFLQTREEVRVRRRDDPAWFEALDKAEAWQTAQKACGGRAPQEVAEEWRNLKRRLDPDNPRADSLDRLRRDRRSSTPRGDA